MSVRKAFILAVVLCCCLVSVRDVSAAIAGWSSGASLDVTVDGRVGEELHIPHAIVSHQGSIYVSGFLGRTPQEVRSVVACWSDNQGWVDLDGSADVLGGHIGYDLVSWHGKLIVLGGFDSEDSAMHHIAYSWDGRRWTPMGPPTPGWAYSAVVHQGTLLVIGNFPSTGNEPPPRLLAWDGTSWEALDGDALEGLPGIAASHAGLYYAAGFESLDDPRGAVYRWVGNNWTQIGDKHRGIPTALFMHKGELHAAYSGFAFEIQGSCLKRWDGQQWLQVSDDCNIGEYNVGAAVSCMGRIVAGGLFPGGGQMVGGIGVLIDNEWRVIAAPEPSEWTPNVIQSMYAVSDHEIWVHGFFNSLNGVPAKGTARLLLTAEDRCDDQGADVGAGLRLHGAFPNPFNPTTTIAYGLPKAGLVSLRIYDLSGRLVRDLVAGEMRTAGRHEETWDGRDASGRRAASGTYFCRIEAGGEQRSMRMMLVK